MKKFIEDGEKRHFLLAAIGGISLIFSFFNLGNPLPFDPAWTAVALCGFPILRGAVAGLVTDFDIKADVLVAMALIASVHIGEIFAAGEVAFIMSLGSLLEERTVRKARDGIKRLVDMTPRTAHVLRDGSEHVIPAEEVKAGDTLRVFPGETIAVDGVITFGRTTIDQSLMTGESLPVDKDIHDEVFSGTVNQLGAFDMRATKVGGDSSLQRMIRLVESADASKAPVVRIMDRWATWIVVAALFTAIGTWLCTGEIIRAVTILVVFCPCALVLSTPTAIMAAIGNATRFGVLISSGDALERLAKVTRVVFDKTGTLTHGKPEVVAVRSFSPNLSDDGLLRLAATIEQRSEHPLGRAIVRHAKSQGISPKNLEQFATIPGRGVSVKMDGKRAVGGTLQLMLDSGLKPTGEISDAVEQYKKLGGTVVYIAMDNSIAGIIVLADTLRSDARETVGRLHDEMVRTTLLTGDNAQAAKNIAEAVGISEVKAELLPEDKVDIIKTELQKSNSDKVCMVGDGINDAPALKAAYVGLAMGSVGSDIAVDAADAVLVRDDIKRLPQLIMLARRTALTIRINIIISMILNIATVLLAAAGLMGPIVGALAHNAGALLIVLNSTRLLTWKYRYDAISPAAGV
jgi:heavy metal translocating P-type ATPase